MINHEYSQFILRIYFNNAGYRCKFTSFIFNQKEKRKKERKQKARDKSA